MLVHALSFLIIPFFPDAMYFHALSSSRLIW